MQNKNNRICPWCGEKLILVGKALDASYSDWEFGQKFTNSSNCRDAFEKDDLWSVGMSMFCEKCGVEIRLQKNPVELHCLHQKTLYMMSCHLIVGIIIQQLKTFFTETYWQS